MHPNEQLLHQFYQAFQRRDGRAMACCYLADARFSDPAFPDLSGKAAGDMWTMLCQRAKDFSLEYRVIQADDACGKVEWVAHYTFNQTGRSVENRIAAEFRFRDGKIALHTDRFNFYRWARQALGPIGWLLGWTPLLRDKVQKQAAAGLAAFQKHQNSASSAAMKPS